MPAGAARGKSFALPAQAALAIDLERGLTALGLDLPSDGHEKLLAYLGLLYKWNAVYNLTSIRDPQQMLAAHLLDSLAIVPVIDRLGLKSVLDVGSGAGLPGIPLAIARPGLQVTLVDAVQKKAAFLTQAKGWLALPNLFVHHARVEALTIEETFDGIVSRAFSEVGKWVGLAGRLLAPGGTMMAMKGVMPYRELHSLPSGWAVREVIPLKVPGLDAERCVVLIRRSGEGKP